MSWFKNIFGSSKSDASKSDAPSGGGSSRSKSSSPPPPGARQAALQEITDLKEQIENLQKKIDFNFLKITEEEEKLKAIIRECGGDATKKERKKPQMNRHLQAIARFRKIIEQEEAKQQNLQVLSDGIEGQLSNVQQQRAVAGAAKVWKAIEVNPDDVIEVQEEIQDLIARNEESTEILTQHIGSQVEVDEDDLESYMAEVAGEGAAQEASLPQIQPALVLPAAGKKQVPVSAAQKESDDELERIMASMA